MRYCAFQTQALAAAAASEMAAKKQPPVRGAAGPSGADPPELRRTSIASARDDAWRQPGNCVRTLAYTQDQGFDAAATANNYLLLYGAFEDFVICDRLGSQLELVPHLVGSNRRPTGQRGALLWFRTGSDVVIPNAFRLLSIPTTA